jgi:hypothetical protein
VYRFKVVVDGKVMTAFFTIGLLAFKVMNGCGDAFTFIFIGAERYNRDLLKTEKAP